MLGGGNDRLFGVICDKLEKPEWRSDERFLTNALRVKNRDTLEQLIEDATTTKTTAEWQQHLEGSGLPYAAVNNVQDTLNHEHGMFPDSYLGLCMANAVRRIVLARNMVQEVQHPSCGPMKLIGTPVKYSHSEPSIRTPPPTLGQHTDEILADIIGMSSSDIGKLKSDGVVS